MMGTIPVPSGWLYQFEFAGMFVQTFVPDPHAEHCQIENVIPLKPGWRWGVVYCASEKMTVTRLKESTRMILELYAVKTPRVGDDPPEEHLKGRALSNSWELVGSGRTVGVHPASSMAAAMRGLARYAGALDEAGE